MHKKLVSFISSSFQQQMTHIFKRNSTVVVIFAAYLVQKGDIFSWVASCIILSFILGEYVSYESLNDELTYYRLGEVYWIDCYFVNDWLFDYFIHLLLCSNFGGRLRETILSFFIKLIIVDALCFLYLWIVIPCYWPSHLTLSSASSTLAHCINFAPNR